ncbi:CDP-glycerol glycerophosphotransferase family protein [Candidatus Nitrosotenuis uzonensis]|uniref:UDP-N-acetylglucosamine 2-epimerase domain-containing protein n=1 Tax=Candidatus Nitrosotenuis uzonensis TaxID=1407055 RepID=A0A812EZE0_9ARCH|nr:CDP-glycerol glycerophosphotransferase family protein [Candidatus Nitrosotenuis uzonensis]CAE6486925.1 hypothetical protein NUZ5A_20230 [Candidatus Nitrosotenuis uzonensis]
MKHCEVVLNFSPPYFEKLNSIIEIKNYQIFTDDVTIKQKGNELGFEVKWIEEYFGYANDNIYQIEENAIRRTEQIYELSKNQKFEDIPILDGLKTDIVSRFIFLEEIEIILQQNERVLFLFSSLQYQSYAILEIGKKFQFENRVGVLECSESKIIKTEFESRAASSYRYVFPSDKEISLFGIPSTIKEFVNEKVNAILEKTENNPIYGFFLTDNSWHLYLNPIYPVLEKFREKKIPIIIFTLDEEATRHLEEKNYEVVNLTTTLHELLYKLIIQIPNPTKDSIERRIRQEYEKSINEIRNQIKTIQQQLQSSDRIKEILAKYKVGANAKTPINDNIGENVITVKNVNKTIGLRNNSADNLILESTDLPSSDEIDLSHVSMIESIYFWVLRHYIPYSKHKIIRCGGKFAKPIFIKIEKRARELQKRKQLQIEREKKRLKQLQEEKVRNRKNELRRIIELKKQKEEEKEEELRRIIELKKQKEEELHNELELKRKIKLESEISELDYIIKEKGIHMNATMQLFAKNIEINEKYLEIEKEISREFEKISLTVVHKCLYDLFITMQNNPSNDHIVQIFQRYFANDTNVLYLARICGTIMFVSKIFEAMKLKSLLLSSGGSPDIDLICSIARKFEIPSHIMTIHPYEEHNPIYKVILNSDKIFVAGERLKKEFLQLGLDEDKIIITGNPKFDHYNNEINTVKTNPELEKNLVIVANSRWNDNDEYWIAELVKYCNKKNLEVLVKIHPVYKNWKQDLNEEKIRKIQELCQGFQYQISIDADLNKLLPKAALLITEFSWTGFEASLCDVPIIVTNFFNKKYSKYSLQYDKEEVALYAENTSKLFECIEKIFECEEIQNRMKVARIKLNTEFNYLNDGKAAERIFNILTK